MAGKYTSSCWHCGTSHMMQVEIAPHYYKAKDIEDDRKKKMPKGVGRAAMSK